MNICTGHTIFHRFMGNKTEKRAAMVFVFLPMQISNACAHVAIVHELPVEFSILYGVCDGEWRQVAMGRLLRGFIHVDKHVHCIVHTVKCICYSTNDFKLRFTLHFRAMCADLRGLFFYAYKQFASLLWLWMIFICVLHAIKRMLMNFFASSFFFFSSFFSSFCASFRTCLCVFQGSRARTLVCVCVCKT